MMPRRAFLLAAMLPLGFALSALAQTETPPTRPPRPEDIPRRPPRPGEAPAQPSGADASTDTEPAEQPTLGDDQDTVRAAQRWLALLDAGKFGPAWDVSAAQLKSAVTRSKWISGVRDVRKPFGKFASRKPSRFGRSHEMPGAPDGDYAIVEFETTFAGGKHGFEQITWVLEDGHAWRVAGYYIK